MNEKMILFVASNPSKLNTDPNVAIIGSKSEKTFNGWAEYLSPDKRYHVINVSDKILDDGQTLKKSDQNIDRLIAYAFNPAFTNIIALGNVAAEALDTIEAKYYKLPHPSPLNRFLNNTAQVEAVLEDCKTWLNKESL